MLDRRMLLGALVAASGARAQESFPNRPLRIVSPFSPGGIIDVQARLLAERMAPGFGQPVVVDARPGASTIVGTEAVARSAPDGHVILVTSSATVLNNPALFAKLPYDAERDLAPISLLSYGCVTLTAPAASPFSDLPGMLRWARAQGRPISYGTWGVASIAHLYGERLKREEGIAFEHIPYRGEQAIIGDVLAGRLDLGFASPVGARPQMAAGTLRALGVVGDRRAAAMPEVPTFAEQGLAGYDLPIFTAAYAPAGTPAAVIRRWSEAFRTALADPAVARAHLEWGQTSVGSTPEELAAIQRAATPPMAALIRLSGARVE